jgi:peroxiredoxin
MNQKTIVSLLLVFSLTLMLPSCKKDTEEKPSEPTTGTTKTSGDGGTIGSQLGETLTETAAYVKKTVEEAATQFSLTDQLGKTVKLTDYDGKIVVLEWINPDCPFVQRHYKAGTFKKLAEAYKDKGVVWLAVNSTNSYTQEKNKAWHTKYDLPYPILDDHGGVVGKLYGAKTTPHMFVLNKTGKVVYQGAIDDDPQGSKGASATNYVKTVLDDLIAGKTPSYTETKPYGCSVKYAM